MILFEDVTTLLDASVDVILIWEYRSYGEVIALSVTRRLVEFHQWKSTCH